MFKNIYIKDISIPLYMIFNILAVLSIILLSIRWNKNKTKYPINIDIIFILFPLIFFMGRLFFYIFLACPGKRMQFFDLEQGGSMFLGAFSGGAFGALIYFELKGIPRLKGLEVFIPYIPIGGILGRLGCFCEGCCYGTVTNSIFGLRFPMGSPAWSEQVNKQLISSDQFFSLPVHPTQLYEILAWILMGIILIRIRNKNPKTGTITLCFLILYFLTRFIEDFLRADYSKIYLNLDLMQWLALIVIPICILCLLYLYRDQLFPTSEKKTNP